MNKQKQSSLAARFAICWKAARHWDGKFKPFVATATHRLSWALRIPSRNPAFSGDGQCLLIRQQHQYFYQYCFFCFITKFRTYSKHLLLFPPPNLVKDSVHSQILNGRLLWIATKRWRINFYSEAIYISNIHIFKLFFLEWTKAPICNYYFT